MTAYAHPQPNFGRFCALKAQKLPKFAVWRSTGAARSRRVDHYCSGTNVRAAT